MLSTQIKTSFLALALLASVSAHADVGTGEKILIQALDPQAVAYHCGDSACFLSVDGKAVFNTAFSDLRGAMPTQIINARLNGQVIDVMSAPGKYFGSYVFLRTRPMTEVESSNKVRELTIQLNSAKREIEQLKSSRQ